MVEMDKKIEVGENAGLVAEVLDFVSGGNLLKVSGRAYPSGEVINNIEVAKKFAWDEVYGSDEYTWADLRSDKMSEIWSVIYDGESKYADVDNKLSGVLSEMSREILSQLDQQHKEFFDNIVSDLKGCLYSRAVLGRSNKFFENIFNIYQSGGWPCGWKGEWPNGHMISYYIN